MPRWLEDEEETVGGQLAPTASRKGARSNARGAQRGTRARQVRGASRPIGDRPSGSGSVAFGPVARSKFVARFREIRNFTTGLCASLRQIVLCSRCRTSAQPNGTRPHDLVLRDFILKMGAGLSRRNSAIRLSQFVLQRRRRYAPARYAWLDRVPR